MVKEDKVISVSLSECENIIERIKCYNEILEASYDKMKKQKPSQTFILSELAFQINLNKKTIKILKNKL